jgi:hypothetical protein
VLAAPRLFRRLGRRESWPQSVEAVLAAAEEFEEVEVS